MATQTAAYKIVPIRRADFGEYQRGNDTGETVDLTEWVYTMRHGAAVYQLGKDALPEGVEDIRGLVHNEPDIIFAIVSHDPNWDSDGASYWGAQPR
jgi:hypothetical protein